MGENDKKNDLQKQIKNTDKVKLIKKTRVSRDIELYDLETGEADLEYTRKFDSVEDIDVDKVKLSKSKNLNKKIKDKNVVKAKSEKISINDIKVLVCGLLYLVSAILLVIGLVKYVNVSSIKEFANYLLVVMILVVIATVLISVKFGNKKVKTIFGVLINRKLSKRKRIVEYLKDSIFISLVFTTFIAILISTDNLFIDFYMLTSNVALNVILIFMFMYVIIFTLSYLCCYLYFEHRISK